MYRLVFREVFSHVSLIVLAMTVTVGAFLAAVWLPNWQLLWTIMRSEHVGLHERVSIPFSLVGSIGTNFTAVSATYTIVISVLLGINVAMLTYYVRTRRSDSSGSGAGYGVGGAVAGVFGIGCAACGTFLLTSLLALVGAGGLISFLPFGGEEFGFLGMGLLGYSVHLTTRKIHEPLVCKT